MEKIVLTPRLKLTLLESLDEGSEDLKWVTAVRSDDGATQWNVLGSAKSVDEVQKIMQTMIPLASDPSTKYRVAYAVHRLIKHDEAGGSASTNDPDAPAESEVIGLVTLKPGTSVPINDDIGVKTDPDRGILRLEIGYMFLPIAWGKGYATEACAAVLDVSRRSKPYFAPNSKLFIDAIVAPANPASMRVLEKAGMKQIGLNEWEDEPVWLAGGWREPSVWVYGTWIFE